jgi:hypothetical protein
MHRLVNPNLRKKSSRKRIITSYGELPERRLPPVLNLQNGGDPDNFLDRTIPPSKSRRCNGATPEFWPGGVPARAVQAILLRPIACRHQTRRDHIGTITIRTERDEVPSQARRALYAIANSECHENLLHPLAMLKLTGRFPAQWSDSRQSLAKFCCRRPSSVASNLRHYDPDYATAVPLGSLYRPLCTQRFRHHC